MTRKKALERWETMLAQAIWPIAKSLANRDGPRAPTTIDGPLGLKFHPEDKANAIADCLENQFTPNDLCDENHKPWVEARVRALFEAEGNDTPERIRPCDLRKLLNSLKLRKVCGIDGIPNECLRLLPRRLLVHLTYLINHCIRLSHFPKPWKEAKVPQNLRPISLLPTTGKVFEKIILQIVQKHIRERNLLNAS
jgi:hypothetical protein